jgi:hypothetical protein
VYEGELNDLEQRDGYGIFYNSEDVVIYKGEWKNDLYGGYGQLFNEDPLVYEGAYDFRDMEGIDSYWT